MIAAAVTFASACRRDQGPIAVAGAGAGGHPLCADGKSSDGPYPKATYAVAPGGTLPDLGFESAGASGAPSRVALHDYFEPCAAESRLLVIRASAAWCGTCRWHAAHTKEWLDPPQGRRLRLLDLLISDQDSMPATAASLLAWRARVDGPQMLAADPLHSLGGVNPSPAPLPLYVLVDTRTMRVVDLLSDPGPEQLQDRLRDAVASLDLLPRPAPKRPVLADGRFTREEQDLLRAMTPPGAPPPDPSNAKADDPAAAALGKKLFSDTALSPGNKVACASCHGLNTQLNDNLPQSTGGVVKLHRNSPPIALAAHGRWQFWDGRADSLWMQALGPLEDKSELNSTRMFVAHVVFKKYRAEYQAIWGPLPELSIAARFPASGKPGSPEWAGMTDADRESATRVFVNVGKSIAAFERTFRVEENALDRYAAGDLTALSASEKDGLKAFFTAGCAQCHHGPRLTDDAFHVVRFPTGIPDGRADRGRIDGIVQLRVAAFGAASAWSDAPRPGTPLVPVQSMLGAFKTPTLRGLPGSAPYGHGGSFATLEELIKVHATAGLAPESSLSAGTSEPWLPKVDEGTRDAIPAFLSVLTGKPVIP